MRGFMISFPRCVIWLGTPRHFRFMRALFHAAGRSFLCRITGFIKRYARILAAASASILL